MLHVTVHRYLMVRYFNLTWNFNSVDWSKNIVGALTVALFTKRFYSTKENPKMVLLFPITWGNPCFMMSTVSLSEAR